MATATTSEKTAAQALLAERDKTERAAEVIDRDPEGAKALIEPAVKAAPNVGEITMADMFQLFSQMQAQQSRLQEQVMTLMTGQGTAQQQRTNADTAKELAADKAQRDATMESWRTEPRRPVFINPDEDEQKIFTVTGQYPPRLYRINGLEFPINVGEIANVPESIASLVEYSQRRRPMQGPPQGLPQFADPARAQFLASAQSVTVGGAGKTGEGRVIPDGLPPHPQELGVRYDHNGQ